MSNLRLKSGPDQKSDEIFGVSGPNTLDFDNLRAHSRFCRWRYVRVSYFGRDEGENGFISQEITTRTKQKQFFHTFSARLCFEKK